MELSLLREDFERQNESIARLHGVATGCDGSVVAEIPDEVDERMTALVEAMSVVRRFSPPAFAVRG